MLYIANVGVNRRVMKVKHSTRRNDAIFGNHVWQTFAQYFPPGLEKLFCVEKHHSYGRYLPTTPSEKPNDVVGVSAG